MARAMEDAIYGAARGHSVAPRYSTSFPDAKTSQGRIYSIRVYDARAHAVETIEAKAYIDASADIVVARSCGCAVAFGDDAAGAASALAVESGAGACEIDPAAVRASLGPPRFEEEIAERWAERH